MGGNNAQFKGNSNYNGKHKNGNSNNVMKPNATGQYFAGNGPNYNYQQKQVPPSNFKGNNVMKSKAHGQYFVDISQFESKKVPLSQFESKLKACVNAEKIIKESMAALKFQNVSTAMTKAEEAVAMLKLHNL